MSPEALVYAWVVYFCMANFKEVIFLLLPALRATQRNKTRI